MENIVNSMPKPIFKFNKPETDEQKKTAAHLIVQAIPEFYEIFSLEYDELLAQISSEFFSGRSETSSTECMINNGHVVAIVSALPARSLRISQMYSVMNLLALVTNDSERVKMCLKQHSELVQPISDGSFYLSRIAVAAEHRGKGFGKVALKRFFDLGGGYRKLSLHVNIKNEVAISMYKSMGFELDNAGIWNYALMTKTN